MGIADRSRRRVLVVDEALQRRIIFGVASVPTLGLAVCALTVAVFCRDILAEATVREIELTSLVPLFLAVLGFTLAASAAFVFQALRFSHRIAGPAYRLVQAMRRIRAGDVSFRINVRRGDHLTELVGECNRLLDWLNDNPPSGVKLGSDMVRMAPDIEPEDAAAEGDAEVRAPEDEEAVEGVRG